MLYLISNSLKNKNFIWLLTLLLVVGSCQEQEIVTSEIDAQNHQSADGTPHDLCELLELPIDQSDDNTTNDGSRKDVITYSDPYNLLGQSHIVVFVWEWDAIDPSFKTVNERWCRKSFKNLIPESNIIFVYMKSGSPYYQDFKNNNSKKGSSSEQLTEFSNYISNKFDIGDNHYHAFVSKNDWNSGNTPGSAYLGRKFFISSYDKMWVDGELRYSNAFVHELGHVLNANHDNDFIMNPFLSYWPGGDYYPKFSAWGVRARIMAKYRSVTSIVIPSRIVNYGDLSVRTHFAPLGNIAYYWRFYRTTPSTPTDPGWNGMRTGTHFFGRLLHHYPNYTSFTVDVSGSYAFETQYSRENPTYPFPSGRLYDTYLYVLDDAGNLIKRNDDKGWSLNPYQSYVKCNLVAGKKYYLVSAGFPVLDGATPWYHASSHGGYWLIIWYNDGNGRSEMIEGPSVSASSISEKEFNPVLLPLDADKQAAEANVLKKR